MTSQLAPSDTSSEHWPSTSEWILRICFAIRCLALGNAYLWNAMERDSDLFGVMFFDWQWPEQWALAVENWSIVAMVVAGTWAVGFPVSVVWKESSWGGLRPPNPRASGLRVDTVLLLFAVLWEIAFALAITCRGGRFYSQITLPSHGLRIAVPLALLLNFGNIPLRQTSLGVLRWGAVLTFAAHGWKAWRLSPEFTSLILGGWQNTLGGSLDQHTAETMLHTIGAVDLMVAAALAFGRWRLIVFCMAVWGTVTALGRTIGVGPLQYPETLLRLVHAGGPLVLFLEWSRANKTSGSE